MPAAYLLTAFSLFRSAILLHLLARFSDLFECRHQLRLVTIQPHADLLNLEFTEALSLQDVNQPLLEVRVGVVLAHLTYFDINGSNFAL